MGLDVVILIDRKIEKIHYNILYMTHLYRWLAALLISAVLSAQIIGTAHAVEYGNTNHHHDDTVCIVGTLSSDQDTTITNIPRITQPAIYIEETHFEALITDNALYLTSPRGPPPRAPPHATL